MKWAKVLKMSGPSGRNTSLFRVLGPKKVGDGAETEGLMNLRVIQAKRSVRPGYARPTGWECRRNPVV